MTTLAICGVGNIGKVHVENLRSIRGCRIAGLFDTNRAVLEQVAAQHDLRAYASLEDMLGDNSVQAVVVATPSDTHAGIALGALDAGKHVFVEKPLAGTIEDAALIAQAARTSAHVVQAGFCERFNVNYLEAKRAVCNGSLGCIRAMHTSRVAPYSMSNPAWELGVLDTAVHNLDLTVWLMGSMPAAVLARAVQVYPDSSIPHSATILMSFADGAMAVDHIAWLKDHGHPLNQCARSRMLIQGEMGIFETDLTDRPSSLLTQDGLRKLDSVIIGAPEYAGCLKLQFEYFLRSIEEGAPVLAPVEDALATERVVMAALRSLRSGQEVCLDAVA
jgi:myo-inositol 2-dehydrogenase / D-chiro-inositol 1-dehydrogenase